MYFQVHTIVQWKTLIESGKDIFKENSLSLLLKYIKANGWNKKIGMLVGPKPEVASFKEYKQEMKEYSDMDLRFFELKRKTEKEGDIEAKSIVMYVVEEKVEELDMKLYQLISNRFDTLSYYSFINGSSEQRKQALIYNRLQNVKMKYEILKNAYVKE